MSLFWFWFWALAFVTCAGGFFWASASFINACEDLLEMLRDA